MRLGRFCVVLCLVCCLACNSFGPSPGTATGLRYRADVEVEPDLQNLGCDIRLTFLQPEDGGTEAVFFLHRQFKIEEVSGEGISGYTFDVDSESPSGLSRMPAPCT